ncbi:MAG: alkaline phosphatase family protein [Bryobacterales bacterium]|nr:alkaline phosphatase family protein [Bryobacterales bacterium]
MRAFSPALLAAGLMLAFPLEAYVGPGAGFAFVGSLFSLIAALVSGALAFLILPFRMAWRAVRGGQGYRKAKIRKLIFLGLDGLEPDLVERLLDEGKLPNLAKLRKQGRYSRLRTTYPALSPVAWSTFATGANPGKHNLFDFLNRNLRTYLPELSSSRVRQPSRVWKIGRWRVPLSKPAVDMRRKSRPFWALLGEHLVGSTVLRVPITFPPEPFQGRLLSAMCAPDLLGTQGSFQVFTTGPASAEFDEGGACYPLGKEGGAYTGEVRGPENTVREGAGDLRIPFRLLIEGKHGSGQLEIGGKRYELALGRFTPWVRLTFRAGLGIKVSGIAQFRLAQVEPNVRLYLSPIAIDPEKPALPISHPSFYAPYLAKLLGDYSTLGLAEDTWALNERVVDEDAFLEQAEQICGEREAMLESALERTNKGVVACVFDTPDRVQHMFYRYLEPEHPAHAANGNSFERYKGTIEDLYTRMDGIVGKTMRHVDDKTVIFVLSDHGFKSFQRGVNLNAWLKQEGYLTEREGSRDDGYLRGIDWDRTKAYSFGLAGIYLNIQGRESSGIVPRAEAGALCREIADKLTGLRDKERDAVAVHRAYPKNAIYSGPYVEAAPDVVVGYSPGYRSSWGVALGKVAGPIFEDNLKAWSGDHCVDPPLIPGVVFCNRDFEAADPGIEDMAPTALRLFGFDPPTHMDGRDLAVETG